MDSARQRSLHQRRPSFNGASRHPLGIPPDLSLVHENAERKSRSRGRQRALVYGPPNNRTYYDTKLSRLAVAVVDPIPFKVKLHQPVNPIVRSGSQNIKVEIVRDANFTKAITVRILTRPPGIGAKSSISIAEGKSVGYYALTANGGSALGTWKIGVQAEAGAPGGGIWRVASDFINLRVEEPFVSMKINMAAVQRGKEGEMICDLNVRRPFEGLATAELKGLPRSPPLPRSSSTPTPPSSVSPSRPRTRPGPA